MYRLNLPSYPIKLQETGEGTLIFDPLRGKYVALTSEEWVRQNFVAYLIKAKKYPPTLLQNELQIQISGKRLRADTVLFTNEMRPKMIVEYKAPTIEISQKTFDQIFSYDLILGVDYLVVTNGLSHFCCKIDQKNLKYTFLERIPDYSEL